MHPLTLATVKLVATRLDRTDFVYGERVEVVAQYGRSLSLKHLKQPLPYFQQDQILTKMFSEDGKYSDGSITIAEVTYRWEEV